MATIGGAAQLREFDLARLDASAHPVSGIAADYAAGQQSDYHRHARCQLLYAIDGVIQVDASSGRWLVPPTKAVWLRPNVEHRLTIRSRAHIRSVLIDAAMAQRLPDEDRVIHVSPLLRELIAEVAHLAPAIGTSRRDRLLTALLLEELQRPSEQPFHLPWPKDAKIGVVCTGLAENPAHPFTAEEWADRLAISPKTFQRRFQKHTGMTFGRWRQQARLLFSLERLIDNVPIQQVALDSGYESHSAYTQAFRKHFGVAPSDFCADSRHATQAPRERRIVPL